MRILRCPPERGRQANAHKGHSRHAFITPEKEQIAAAARFGCDAIELHTGQYADARTEKDIYQQFKWLEAGRDLGIKKGMIVHAGHGLTYRNIGPIAAMEDLSELNIGHSIIAKSMFVGIREATAEMIRLIDKFGKHLFCRFSILDTGCGGIKSAAFFCYDFCSDDEVGSEAFARGADNSNVEDAVFSGGFLQGQGKQICTEKILPEIVVNSRVGKVNIRPDN